MCPLKTTYVWRFAEFDTSYPLPMALAHCCSKFDHRNFDESEVSCFMNILLPTLAQAFECSSSSKVRFFSILNRPTDLMAWIVAPKFCASILSSLKQQFRISRDDGDYWLSSTLFTWWKQRVTRFQINEAANSRQKPNSRPSVENTLIFALPGKLKARHSLSRPFGLSESFNNIIAEEYPSNPTLTTRLLHLELIQGESRWYANAYTQPSVRNKRLVLRFGQLALGSTIRRGYEYPYPQLQHSNDHISTRL